MFGEDGWQEWFDKDRTPENSLKKMGYILDRIDDFVEKKSNRTIQVARGPDEEECLACRVMGTGFFFGVSAYSARLYMLAKRRDYGNRIFFGGMGSCFFLLGLYRMATPTKPHQVADALPAVGIEPAPALQGRRLEDAKRT